MGTVGFDDRGVFSLVAKTQNAVNAKAVFEFFQNSPANSLAPLSFLKASYSCNLPGDNL